VMSKHQETGRATLILVVSCALAAAGAAMASETIQKVTPEEPAATLKLPEHAYALSDAVMRVFLDPETGQLREPNAEEMAELGRAARRVTSAATTEPQVFSLPGGGIGAEVPPELMSHSNVQLRQDGTVAYSCTKGAEEDKAILVAPSATATPEEQ
jgi:hypothetical protein